MKICECYIPTTEHEATCPTNNKDLPPDEREWLLETVMCGCFALDIPDEHVVAEHIWFCGNYTHNCPNVER